MVVRAPEVAVHPQGAIVAGGESGAGEDPGRGDARGGEGEGGRYLPPVFQAGAAAHRDGPSAQDGFDPKVFEVPTHDASRGPRGGGHEVCGSLDQRDLGAEPGFPRQRGQVDGDLAARCPAPNDDYSRGRAGLQGEEEFPDAFEVGDRLHGYGTVFGPRPASQA